MKKIFLFSVVIILTVILLYILYFPLSIPLYDLLNNKMEMNDVEKIEAEIFFTFVSPKKVELNNLSDVNTLVNLLKNIKVKPVEIETIKGPSKLVYAYDLYFYYNENRCVTYFHINDKNYITFNAQYYKITNKSPFEEIYKIIIQSQNKKDVDDFYRNIFKE